MLRPTHGILPIEGLAISFAPFDVPGFFGKDLAKCRIFADAWYGKALPAVPTSPPSAILYPTDYLPVPNVYQQKLIDDFVTDLEASLGIKRTHISFQELWNKNPPPAAEGQELEDFMKDVGKNAFWYDDYHSQDEFRNGYKKELENDPYIGPAVRWQWNRAKEITKEIRDEGIRRLGIYQEWFLSTVLRAEKENILIILPIEQLGPRYRDEPPL